MDKELLEEVVEEVVEEEKKKKKRWLLLLLFLLALVLGGGYYLWSHSSSQPLIAGDYLPNIKDAKKMSDQEIKAIEQQAVDASKFNMVIKPQAIFENSQAEGSLYIQNPATNAYPIDVVIHLDETQEQVYASGGMAPGFEINGAKLEKELAPGSYPATATFNIYDESSQEKRGQVQAGLTLEVNS